MAKAKKKTTKKKATKKKAAKRKPAKKSTKKKASKRKSAKKKSPRRSKSVLDRFQKVTTKSSPIAGLDMGRTTYVGGSIIEELPTLVPVIVQPERKKKEWIIVMIDLRDGEIVTETSGTYATPGQAAKAVPTAILPGPDRTPTQWWNDLAMTQPTATVDHTPESGDLVTKTAANPCLGFHMHKEDFKPLLRALREEGALTASNPFGCAYDPTKRRRKKNSRDYPGSVDLRDLESSLPDDASPETIASHLRNDPAIAFQLERDGYANTRAGGSRRLEEMLKEGKIPGWEGRHITREWHPTPMSWPEVERWFVFSPTTAANGLTDFVARQYGKTAEAAGKIATATEKGYAKGRKSGPKKRKKNPRDKDTYIDYLENTFIPDLKESGQVYTAEDLEGIVAFLRGARSHDGRSVQEHVDFLENTLIPDLRDSGKEYTAEDFEEGIELLRMHRRVENAVRPAHRNGATRPSLKRKLMR